MDHGDQLIACGAPGIAAAAGAELVGSGQTATLDCVGGGAEFVGSNNRFTLTGDCTSLEMFGSNNMVTIALANEANIEIVGSNNTITWTTPDGKDPRVEHLGWAHARTLSYGCTRRRDPPRPLQGRRGLHRSQKGIVRPTSGGDRQWPLKLERTRID